ncbi:MAG: hypothetical protein KC503_18650, partial [Myxococcales bacterium]|nr:hypothetical protein [Myxococcales bacterium]
MSDDSRKSNPDVNSVVERYGRRGGSARKGGGPTGPTKKAPPSSGFWQRVVDWVAPPTDDEATPDGVPAVHAAGMEAAVGTPSGAPPSGPPPLGAPAQPPPPLPPSAMSPTLPPTTVPPLTGQPSMMPPPATMPSAPPQSATITPAPGAGPVRVALELVLPSGTRLLLVGQRDPSVPAVGLLTVSIEGAPTNDPRVLEGLRRLSIGDAPPAGEVSATQPALPQVMLPKPAAAVAPADEDDDDGIEIDLPPPEPIKSAPPSVAPAPPVAAAPP